MANTILSPAFRLFDFSRKFGTWVKPPVLAASATAQHDVAVLEKLAERADAEAFHTLSA